MFNDRSWFSNYLTHDGSGLRWHDLNFIIGCSIIRSMLVLLQTFDHLCKVANEGLNADDILFGLVYFFLHWADSFFG